MSPYTCGVCALRIVLQDPGEAKVGDFTLQCVVYEDIAGSQVTVDVAHVRKIFHSCSDASHHPNKLEGGKLPIVILMEDETM